MHVYMSTCRPNPPYLLTSPGRGAKHTPLSCSVATEPSYQRTTACFREGMVVWASASKSPAPLTSVPVWLLLLQAMICTAGRLSMVGGPAGIPISLSAMMLWCFRAPSHHPAPSQSRHLPLAPSLHPRLLRCLSPALAPRITDQSATTARNTATSAWPSVSSLL